MTTKAAKKKKRNVKKDGVNIQEGNTIDSSEFKCTLSSPSGNRVFNDKTFLRE